MCPTLTRRRLDFGDLQLDSVDKLQLFDSAMNNGRATTDGPRDALSDKILLAAEKKVAGLQQIYEKSQYWSWRVSVQLIVLW